MRLFSKRATDKVTPWMFFRWMDINGREEGVKYLTRLYLIQTPWFGVKLHWFWAPDPDTCCHDHPWWFVSILLRGRYEELRQWFSPGGEVYREERTERGVGSVVYRDLEAVHRITSVRKGTLTVILNGPKRKSWGFYEQSGEWSRRLYNVPRHHFVPWRKYLGLPEDTPSI